jgi:homogentisate phytyltransferase / homogentisate geranylgeranyltransferase
MMIEKVIERISNTKITFRAWIAAFLGIMLIRFFLENFSSIPITGYWTSDAATIVHGCLYYLAATISLLLFLGLFVDRAKLERLALFALIGNIVAPLFDILVSNRAWSPMHYISADSGGLLRNFIMPASISGITTGMKVEFFLGACLLLWYVLYATKSVAKAVFAVLGSYAILFLWGALPSVWKIIHDLFSSGSGALAVSQFFITSEAASVVVKNFLHPTIQLSYFRGAEVFFDVAVSQLYYILIFVLVAAYFFVRNREKFFATLKNARQFRAAHYYLMVGLGLAAGLKIATAWISWNWLDITSLIVLFLAYGCARMYAGGVNDIEDLEIDKVSNPGRPLPSHLLTVDDIKNTNLFFLLWALLGGFLAGHYVFFTIIVALFVSHAYSVPPLRLKSYPLIATFLIALASLAAFAAGFYFVSLDKTTKALPVAYIALILVGLTLGENVKDIKDIEGDRKEDVYTFPVVFGEKNGKRIVGALAAAAFLLVPLLLQVEAMLVPSILAGVGIYFLVNRKRYSERPIFLLGSAYAALAIWILFF